MQDNNLQVVSLSEFKREGLIIVDKDQFLNLLIEVNVKSAVDKRVKWIDRKTARLKYGVSRNWLLKAEADSFSVLKFQKGKFKTSATKYLEQSIIDEQNRRA